jgi:hypothetical protein
MIPGIVTVVGFKTHRGSMCMGRGVIRVPPQQLAPLVPTVARARMQ